MNERALLIPCGDASLVGILHEAGDSPIGVVVVVGGPQYRVGSHRQFVLLARALAQAGLPTLRFDYRGMGDSEGAPRTFEHVEDDIRAAIDRLLAEAPTVRRIVLWGLCDGASASLMYAPRDPRVSAIVLLNPWARTDSGIAQAYVKHYYARRVLDPTFWRALFTGKVRIGHSIVDFVRKAASATGAPTQNSEASRSFTERMTAAADRFKGEMLLIISGRDLTAREFEAYCSNSHVWQRVLGRPACTRRVLAEADHTFSSREWRDAVSEWTRAWLTRESRTEPGGSGNESGSR